MTLLKICSMIYRVLNLLEKFCVSSSLDISSSIWYIYLVIENFNQMVRIFIGIKFYLD
jgi:hypothetical protein